MAPPVIRVHVDAFIGLLTTAGLTVGNHEAPTADDPHDQTPYVVVRLLPGGLTDGTAADPHAFRAPTIQTTCVGSGPEQALWLDDKVAEAVDGKTLTVAGRNVAMVQPIGASSGVQRDHDLTPALFYAARSWRFWTFPA